MAARKKDFQNISMDSSQKKEGNSHNERPESPTPVTPAFILAYDIGDIDGYYLGRKIGETTGLSNVVSVQLVKNLWVIYLKDNASKIKLASQGLSIDGLHVTVHNTNPFMTRSVGAILNGEPYENKQWIKILIKDLRHSVSHEDVKHMFNEVFKLDITSQIRYSNYRDEEGKLTSLLNGDRFVWVDPDKLKRPLPRNAQCGIWKCRLFHKNQFPNSQKECYKCFSVEHLGRNCPNQWCCKVCKEPGHKPGSIDCPHFKMNWYMRPFGGKGDPMSNHFECEFEFNHVPALTAENHWFCHKALINGQKELSDMCLHASDGKEAKYLSHSILCVDNWDDSVQGYELMKNIVRAKFTHVKQARDELYISWYEGEHIVEAVPSGRDLLWGSSMNREGTLQTDPKYWPGKNKLGQILMELAKEFWGEGTPKSDENVDWSAPVPALSHLDTVNLKNIDINSDRKSTDLNETWDSEPVIDDDENTESVKEEGEIIDEMGVQHPLVDPNSLVIPPTMPKELMEHSRAQVVKTREEIGAMIKAARASSVPRHFAPTKTPASKLREQMSKGESRSRSKSPKKSKSKVNQNRSQSPRSSSVKRASESPKENVNKISKSDSVESISTKSKFENGTVKPS